MAENGIAQNPPGHGRRRHRRLHRLRAPHRRASRRRLRAGRGRAELATRDSARGVRHATSASPKTASTPATRRWRRRSPRVPTASRPSRSSRPTTCISGPAKAFLEAGIHVICDKPLTSHARGRPRAGRDQAEERRQVPAHPQLHRLSAGPAGPRAGEVRRARQDPRRPGRVSAGLADHCRPIPATSRPPGAPIPSAPAPAAPSATSAPTPTTSPASSPA